MDAYAKSKTPKEDRDTRSTPTWVYEAIVETIGVRPTFDVAAEAHTSVCGEFRYWSKENDSLSIDWFGQLVTSSCDGHLPVVWMNPPYSDPVAWCRKAAEESAKGMIVVGLLPDDRSVGWYQHYIHGVCPTVFLTPSRIPFIMPDTGKEQAGNPKGSIIPIWVPWTTGQTQEVYIPTYIWRKHRPSKAKTIHKIFGG